MKPLMKTLFMMLIAVALLAACGDDTASDDAVDSNDEATEPEENAGPEENVENNGMEEANEETEVGEEGEESQENGNEDSSEYADDQQLTLGETGLHDSAIGTQEITLNSVKAEDEVEGETLSNGFFVIVEVTIKNVSVEPVDIANLTHAQILNDQESGHGPYWYYGFDDGELDPGESLTGELVFDVNESSYYELVYGSSLFSNTNEVRWRFEPDDIE